MMGYQRPQPKLFCQFNLDDRVPANHILRQISEVIDFCFVYEYVRPFYSHTGAPSVDPVVIFKMALLGYLYGITSERKLAERVPA
jgi:transposase